MAKTKLKGLEEYDRKMERIIIKERLEEHRLKNKKEKLKVW